MYNWKEELTLEDLKEPYYTIGIAFGVDIARKMEELFCGQTIYFPDLKRSSIEKLKCLIKDEFNGYNTKYLAKKYEVSDKFVQNICKSKK